MTPTDPADRAQTMGELADRALVRLAPLRFGLAQSRQERDAVRRMRLEIVVAEGWMRPEDVAGSDEGDADEAQATFVTCHDGDALVGSMRLVRPRPDGLLPVEREFGVRARPAGRVAEVGRLIVAARARSGHSHRIIGGLCARAWHQLAAWNCDRALSTATPELIELYEGLGLRVTVLGPARPYWGARRAPILVEGHERSFGFLTAASSSGTRT